MTGAGECGCHIEVSSCVRKVHEDELGGNIYGVDDVDGGDGTGYEHDGSCRNPEPTECG